MARRSKGNTSSTESQATASTPEPTQEDAVSTATEEQPAVEAEKKEEKAIDLSAFEAAVAAGVAEMDASTGTVPDGLLSEITKEYRQLDGAKAKNAAKKKVNQLMRDSMAAKDLDTARAYLNISEDALVAGGGSSAPKEPADPTEAFVQRKVTLDLARSLVTVPEGVAEDHEERSTKLYNESYDAAQSYLAWVTGDEETRGDEPEVSAFVKNAVKLSLGKAAKAGSARSGSSFTGERGDIGKHILNAFADKEPGTFMTVAEIRATKSTGAGYDDRLPSAGAISARLFPESGKFTLEGVQPGTNEKGNKGATKL